MHIDENKSRPDPGQLKRDGYQLIRGFYSREECRILAETIAAAGSAQASGKTVYALRQVSACVPDFVRQIDGERCLQILKPLFARTPVLVKSIWFDKPADANWFVPWHQDSVITVDRRLPGKAGFFNWTTKGNYAGVQPPPELLEQVWTMRIHLDDATAANGALWVLPGSHTKGLIRSEEPVNENDAKLIEASCGDVLLMRPLLLHRSSRATVNLPRRILHLEFSDYVFPDEMQWAENHVLQ